MAEDDAPWSNLGFAEEAAVFKGPTQNARVLSEGWVAAHAFCPSCDATPPTGAGRRLWRDDRAARGAEQSQPDGRELRRPGCPRHRPDHDAEALEGRRSVPGAGPIDA